MFIFPLENPKPSFTASNPHPTQTSSLRSHNHHADPIGPACHDVVNDATSHGVQLLVRREVQAQARAARHAQLIPDESLMSQSGRSPIHP